VFIPLFGEPSAAACVELLRSRVADAPLAEVRCLEPPIGGLAFITTGGEVSEMLDAWWSHLVPEECLPVLLALHEPGLEGWVGGLDAEVVVGVSGEEEAALYAAFPNVRTVAAQDPRALTEYTMESFRDCFRTGVGPAGSGSPAIPPGATPYRPRVAMQQGAVSGRRITGEAEPAPSGQPVPPPAARSAPAHDVGSLIGRAARLLNVGGRGGVVPEELGRLALSHQTGKIAGVTSRAGGVGKTAIAAALGIVYGEAVQDSGWCAAVVDQNIGNPDQWGRLSLTTQVRTVSEIMADIEAGSEWTVPAWGRTPALAVYPERRDLGEAYAPAQIERFAGQLRQLHMISVVDLPNRIPAFTSAEAAVCAGWVAVSDLLLLPTTDDPTRLQGVLEYLDAPLVRGDPQTGSRGVPVIVPYVRSPLRSIREDPGVRGMLELVRQRVLAVVEIPKNERATLAIVKGQPITEVDAGLRDAYVELAMTVARALLTLR
jgi:MinD-like ATPase involved in chromosome partitioning or flagellar assembly